MPEQVSSALGAAEHALTLASVRPEEARREAIGVLMSPCGAETRTVASRALGLAQRELGNLAAALHHLDRAVRSAQASGLGRRAGQARMTLSAVLAERGDISAALIEADRAAEALTGDDAGRLMGQRAMVLARAGRFAEALASYRRALPRVRRAGDARFEAGMLVNRGALHVYVGRLHYAEADLRRGEDLAIRAGLDRIRAIARWNMAFAAIRRGDIPRTLALLDDVEQRLEGSAERAAFARVERAEALMQAGLVGEAREILTSAAELIEAAGFAAEGAEARLTLARAQLLDRAPDEAVANAHTSYWAFVRQRRIGWAYLAEHVTILARWMAGERSPQLLRDAGDATSHLVRWGWEAAAAHSRIVTGRVAIDLGETSLAAAELSEVARTRTSGPVDVRIHAWYAAALQRLASGNRRGASAALRAGLRVVDEHAASAGATDLRVHATGWGRELAALGMGLALASGRARSVFAWMERWRAGATRHRPVQPPEDAKLAAALAELRRVTADLGSAAAQGHGASTVRALRTRQVRLEEEIRRQSRHARGSCPGPRPEPSVAAVTDALGDRAFVSYASHEDELAAVTVVDGRVRLVRLPAYGEALRAMGALRFCIHRLARRHGAAASLEAARVGMAHAGAWLDRLLVAPLADQIGDRELVVAPTGHLHAMPWSALPSLADRPLTVTPSAAMWLTTLGNDQRPGSSGPVLVAGPELEHAEDEVAALTAHYPRGAVLAGTDASAEAVRGALDGADVAHLAAHGRFREDNPLFSSILLADGPLMVHDMERLPSAPRRVVLSACDAAVSAIRPGNELMGLSSALLSLGTATLVASVSPVHDEEASTLMVAFHDRLAAGDRPAHALAEARRETGVPGFACFGAG